jgi:phosphoglycerate dehydrogenase-like enzyme
VKSAVDSCPSGNRTGATQVRFLIVNPTCLALLNRHAPWLDALGVDAIAGLSDTARWVDDLRDSVRCGRGFDAIIGPAAGLFHLPATAEPAMGRLKALSLASSGHEWVDLASATRHGLVVTHAPIESLGEVVADLTWGLLLAVARRIPDHHLRLQRGHTARGMGAMVWGRTLGIVGLGNIGKKVARRAAGFGMQVLAAEKSPVQDYCTRHGITILPLGNLLERSDYVSLHLRLDAETEGIIGARELGLMKREAFLINTARSQLVDGDALADALLAGRIAGAALDDAPQGAARSLLHLPNVVFTPHIGNRVLESADAVCRQAYVNALDVVRGRMPDLRYVLNPEVYGSRRVVSGSG